MVDRRRALPLLRGVSSTPVAISHPDVQIQGDNRRRLHCIVST